MDLKNIRYRKAEAKDMPSVLDILNSASGNIGDIGLGKFLVAQDGNKIIGCVRIQNMADCSKLTGLVVLPNYRRMGIGSALVIKILNENIERPVCLFCNIKYETFYNKFSFKKVEVKNIPLVLKNDYNNLLNLKFANNAKILIAMILV